MKEEIKKKVKELITEGKNYAETRKVLESEGIDSKGLQNVFYKLREAVNPTKKVEEVLEHSAEKREKPDKKPLPKWSAGKQKEADSSSLAGVINKGLYSVSLPFCKSKKLEQKHVDEINLGGGIVGIISHYTKLDLGHPVMILVSRSILFAVKFISVCGKPNGLSSDSAHSASPQSGETDDYAKHSAQTGIKEDWQV